MHTLRGYIYIKFSDSFKLLFPKQVNEGRYGPLPSSSSKIPNKLPRLHLLEDLEKFYEVIYLFIYYQPRLMDSAFFHVYNLIPSPIILVLQLYQIDQKGPTKWFLCPCNKLLITFEIFLFWANDVFSGSSCNFLDLALESDISQGSFELVR